MSTAGYVTPTALSAFKISVSSDDSVASGLQQTRRRIFSDTGGEDDEDEVGEMPGYDEQGSPSSSHTASVHRNKSSSSHSSESTCLPIKRMKAASASSQFYTTIVVKVCVTCREWIGCVAADRRAAFIFKKVEGGLRDRVAFPLPPNVVIKDLMANSYFPGNDADANYRKFCGDESTPLTEAMIDLGNRLYNNKFTDIKKLITNHVLPKFLHIYNEQTGSGGKSGYVVDINLLTTTT